MQIDEMVVSSRVRLARNLRGLPFPQKLNDNRASLIAKKVSDALIADRSKGEFSLYRVANMSTIDGNVLREKHLISSDLLENEAYGAVVINENETVSVMVNEEDHIREQCILPGLRLVDAYDCVNQIDDLLGKRIEFAFDPKLGYLTACPTNVGTGMRASAMMFLPGLSVTHNLENCVRAVGQLNMTIRGVYGEGSEADGYLYQISNQKTLGVTEKEILSAVQTSIEHIAEAEAKARQALYAAQEPQLRDQIYRAYGILCNAYLLDSKEFMRLLAFVKLGVYYGMLVTSDAQKLEKLVTDAQPANIVNLSGGGNEENRDIFRAAYVAKTLRAICQVR